MPPPRQPTSAASTSTRHRARQHRAGGARYREGGLSGTWGRTARCPTSRPRARPCRPSTRSVAISRCTWTCSSSRWPTASSSCRCRKPRSAAAWSALFAADHPRRSARAAGRRGAELQQGPGRADHLNRGARARWCRWSRKAACRAPWTDLKVEDKSPWHASVGLNNDYSADTQEVAQHRLDRLRQPAAAGPFRQPDLSSPRRSRPTTPRSGPARTRCLCPTAGACSSPVTRATATWLPSAAPTLGKATRSAS